MIYNDINESTYSLKFNDLVFYFSSEFYREKFIKEYTKFIHNEKMKLKIRLKCDINCDEVLMLLLYRKIEKRGFKVLYKEKEINDKYLIDMSINKISYK